MSDTISDEPIGVVDPQARPDGPWATIRAYVALTKPRIIELLLITTLPAMVLAADGWPGTWLVVTTLIGGTLSAGGANAINNYVDRDIDPKMRRTHRRPLARAHVPANRALDFGIGLGVSGFLWLWWQTNLLAASLSTAALLFYVFVYTIGMKRTTPQNIVIGGAAGAAPVLVGWAAVAGSLDLSAWIMFAVVFFWTPPHFWALALRYKDDYAAAGVPMLPVVAGDERTIRSIIRYAAALWLVTLLLWPAASMGWVYLVGTGAIGGWFLVETVRLIGSPERAMRVFHVSTYHLALWSAAIVVDVFVG
jgi:protoheme IX farnesyltransferase